jgi:hypothetical protein
MGILNGVKIEFEESMSGYLGMGQTDPVAGVEVGQREKTEIRFDVRINIEDLGRFLKISDHQAALMGIVSSDLFGCPSRKSRPSLFARDYVQSPDHDKSSQIWVLSRKRSQKTVILS